MLNILRVTFKTEGLGDGAAQLLIQRTRFGPQHQIPLKESLMHTPATPAMEITNCPFCLARPAV